MRPSYLRIPALEVLRGYQQDLKASGFDTVYECAGDACGGSNIFSYGLPKYLLPRAWEGAAVAMARTGTAGTDTANFTCSRATTSRESAHAGTCRGRHSTSSQ